MAGVTPWSFSSLSAFETCPRRFYLTRISKQVAEPQTEATLWGNQVHKALELAVAGQKGLDAKYSAYQPIVDRLRATEGVKYTEQKVGLTENLKPTSFFAKDVWYRGVLDVTVVRDKTAVVLDYKTGKVKSDGDQLRLFAATAFAQYPHVETVRTGYLWLQHDKTTPKTFRREEAPVIWQEFVSRVNRMEDAQERDRWLPNPSGLCAKWCPVGKKLCDFCGKD